MAAEDRTFAWWNGLRHQGLLISPALLPEFFPGGGRSLTPFEYERLRDRYTSLLAHSADGESSTPLPAGPMREWLDYLFTGPLGHARARWLKQDRLGEALSARLPTGERLRPHRALVDGDGKPLLLVWVDEARRLGVGRSKTQHARLLALLRGTGVKLGLFTNGLQFRLCYAGLDHDASAEWEAEAWFAGAESRDQLHGFLSLLGQDGFAARPGLNFPLLDAAEASRTRQGELAQVLGEQVRQAVEHLLDGLPAVLEQRADLVAALAGEGGRRLSEAEQWRALYQAVTRLVMRLVVLLYAEARDLLPRSNAFYHQSYSVEQLWANLRADWRLGPAEMRERRGAWRQLLSLYRLIQEGSSHPDLTVPAYGGQLFAAGDPDSDNPVRRAVALFEADEYELSDFEVHEVLKLLKQGKVRVRQGRGYKLMSGPVDFSDLRTEYIGIMYQGLLDYELRRVGDDPMVVMGIGSEPVLPLSLLEGLDPRGLQDLIQKLGKAEKSDADESESDSEEAPEDEAEAEPAGEVAEEPEAEEESEEEAVTQTHRQRALAWALQAVEAAGLVKRPRRGGELVYEQQRVRAAAALLKRTLEPGSFYLVRWGGTRKGSGTFYTRPQLSVPLTHRTLEPLCYERLEDGSLRARSPEAILALKVVDPAMGSGSFLVAALNYLTDALVASLHAHQRFEPAQSGTAVLLLGGAASGREADELLPCRPDDPRFDEMLRARLKRHVVERCIYGVDINPLAVELARVSLWVETMDKSLPFEFLDHKLKVGNSLIGCWLHRFQDYPAMAWVRDGGDRQHDGVQHSKGARTKRMKDILDKQARPELIDWVISRTHGTGDERAEQRLATLRERFHMLHSMSKHESEREEFYRQEIQGSAEYKDLRAAMDRWCAIWFWPADDQIAPLTPRLFDAPTSDIEDKVAELRERHRFFHWELEYPEVFTPERAGFDAVLGNPPWDVQKPKSLEFFSQYDPIYRTYGKQEALKQQKRMFLDFPLAEAQWVQYLADFRALSNWAAQAGAPFDLPLGRGTQAEELRIQWERLRRTRPALMNGAVPFCYQGGADLNTYKLFLETAHYLLGPGGRVGFLVQGGVYSDKGAAALRALFLNRCRWDFLFGFVNERFVFSGLDHRYRICAMVVQKGESTEVIPTTFRVTVKNAPHADELADLLTGTAGSVMPLPVDWLRSLTGDDLVIPTFRGPGDKAIFEKLYRGHRPLREVLQQHGNVLLRREFDMTNDSKLLIPHSTLVESGTLQANDDVRDPRIRARLLLCGNLPLLEGKSIGQANPVYKDSSRFFVPLPLKRLPNWSQVVWREVARATDSRTVLAATVAASCYVHKLWTISGLSPIHSGRLTAILNSFVLDWLVRMQLGGATVGLFVINPLPIPELVQPDAVWSAVDRWVEALEPGRSDAQERLRSRCMMDAAIAWLYGLTGTQVEEIISAEIFPALDKRLPEKYRQPTLTVECFHHLESVGIDRFCQEGWELPAPAAALPRKEMEVWAPPGGWEQAWTEARAMLSADQWAMLTGEALPGLPTALAEVAATKGPELPRRKGEQARLDLS